jgi:hypothetical protein
MLRTNKNPFYLKIKFFLPKGINYIIDRIIYFLEMVLLLIRKFKNRYFNNISQKPEINEETDYSLVIPNKALVNKYNGESCFLIGCGPSIKNQKIYKLKNQKVIGLSTFFYHQDYEALNIIANVFTGYTYHKNNYNLDEWIHYYNEIYKKCKNEIFLHEDDFDFISNNKEFIKQKETKYYKTKSNIYNILINETPSIDKEIYEGQNIAIFGIQIAISMGFKKIYLLGLDHDWIYRLINKSQTKFHDSKSDYNITNQDQFSFWVKVYYNLWSDYEYIKKFAEQKNVEIINVTEGGVLDVFERKNFEDVLPVN